MTPQICTDASPTEKFLLYEREIAARLQSRNLRTQRYARYEQALIQKSHFVRLNGAVHHYHDSHPDAPADMPTIILIHGWDCWWMWWHEVIAYLNQSGVRTIAYDLKGHGWSDEGEDYSLSALSLDLHALVQHLGLKRYHIAAFSLGSFVALNYAQRFEDEISSLTFFNFGIFPNSAQLEKIIPTAIPFIFDKILRKIKIWWLIYAYARLTLARNHTSKENILVGVNSLRFISGKAIRETAKALAKREVTENLPKQIANLSIPVLLVAGKGDQVVSWKHTKALYEYARNGRFELIKKCGHLITLELPKRTAELILSQMQLASPTLSTTPLQNTLPTSSKKNL
ncbi:MAG: alpha/beta fold hydrolase [Candidatus Thermochlorobacter sp.]